MKRYKGKGKRWPLLLWGEQWYIHLKCWVLHILISPRKVNVPCLLILRIDVLCASDSTIDSAACQWMSVVFHSNTANCWKNCCDLCELKTITPPHAHARTYVHERRRHSASHITHARSGRMWRQSSLSEVSRSKTTAIFLHVVLG